RTPKPPLGRHRAALAVGVAGCLLAGGFGVQHLLRAAPPQDAALTPGAATSSPEGSGAPGSAASAQQIPAASPEEQAEPAEPAPDAQTQPAAAPPSSKDTPSPRA